MDEIVFSSLIAFNGMLTGHCNNLSTHHYHIADRPCFDTQFHATIFLRCWHIFQEKEKAIELLFCTKEIGKELYNKEIVLTRIGLTRKGDPRKGCEPFNSN